MYNKHSSCARNRNENRTVIFYARKHATAAPAAASALEATAQALNQATARFRI